MREQDFDVANAVLRACELVIELAWAYGYQYEGPGPR